MEITIARAGWVLTAGDRVQEDPLAQIFNYRKIVSWPCPDSPGYKQEEFSDLWQPCAEIAMMLGGKPWSL